MCQGGACGELERPPSRSNMSLWAIIELVCMGVCGILCLVEIIDIFKTNKSMDVWLILKLIVDFLVVIGLCLVVYGLFCGMSANPIRSGILCFVIGCILELVILIYSLVATNAQLTFYGFCYIVLLVFLAYILWIQSAHI